MQLLIGDTIAIRGNEWVFTKIENTKAKGVWCILTDKNGTIARITQQEVELLDV